MSNNGFTVKGSTIPLTAAPKNAPASSRFGSFEDSGLPESYRQEWENNPYKNANYQLGLWDKIGNALGFRTAEDKTREQWEQYAAEYESQLLQRYHDETYNSELEQAKRMREAGINPGLNGTTPSQTSSEPIQHVAPESFRDNSEQFNNAMSMLGNTFTSFLGIANGLQGLELQDLEIMGKSIANAHSVFDFGKSYSTDYADTNDALSMIGLSEGMSADERVMNIQKIYGVNRRRAKRLDFILNRGLSYRHTAKGQKEVVDNANNVADSLKTLYGNLGLGIKGTTFSEDAKRIYGDISKYSVSALKLKIDADLKYLKAIDADKRARSENATNQMNIETGEAFSKYKLADLAAAKDAILLEYQRKSLELERATLGKFMGQDKHPLLTQMGLSLFSGVNGAINQLPGKALDFGSSYMLKTIPNLTKIVK